MRKTSLTFILPILPLLFSCAGEDDFADLQAFLGQVEGGSQRQLAPAPSFPAPQPLDYGAAGLRSPFKPWWGPSDPALLAGKVAQPAGGQTPQAALRHRLEDFPISALTLVGTLRKAGKTFALIEDAQGAVHPVQAGDYLGNEQGQVQAVAETQLSFIETVPDGQGGWRRRPGVLILRGSEGCCRED